MKCKSCKREIPDNSIFCNWCGERQINERKSEIRVPKAKQLPSGTWFIQLRTNGQSISISEKTESECIAKAKAIKAGLIETKKAAPKATVGQVIDSYIASNTGTLSPSTIRGYIGYRANRFQHIMSSDVSKVDWQKAISIESQLVAPKTVINAWHLITVALDAYGLEVPNVNLPQKVKAKREWFDYEQILSFCEAIKGKPGELGALLALHSLRRSEIYGLDFSKIDLKAETILVSGSVVYRGDGEFVYKDSNKNESSQRTVPIVIPRLLEILKSMDANISPLIPGSPNTLYTQINKVCKDNELPLVGVHGLRHSFASLGYHLRWPEAVTAELGGWSDINTVHRIYLHLAEKDKIAAAKKMKKFYSKNPTQRTER